MKNVLANLVINASATIGEELFLTDMRPSYKYTEGIKGEQDGMVFTCLSEKMNYDKVDVKVIGLLKAPFAFDGTLLPVTFEGLEAKAWQDWNDKGAVKLSLSAKNICIVTQKGDK